MKRTITKILVWIFAIVFILFVIIGIYRSHWRESHKNTFDFPSSIKIVNVSGVPYLDTLTALVANQVLGYDSIEIIISKTSLSMGSPDMSLVGFIEKDPYSQHRYFMYVNPVVLDGEAIRFVSHEMIHVDQMESGSMIGLPELPGKIFDGDTINYFKVPYAERKFEIDAIMRATAVELTIRKLIYKKFIW